MVSKEEIEAALDQYWNLGPAATSLGIGYSTLKKYIKHYGIKHNSRKSRNGASLTRNQNHARAITAARQNKKLKALAYLGGMRCSRCGFDTQVPDCYAFHHKDPSTKSEDWGKMKTNNWSIERTKEELDKCVVLCHNCHSIVHYEIRTGTLVS